MSGASMRIIRKLPPAPKPTRAEFKRRVVGNLANELQVIDVDDPPKPSPAIHLEKKLAERHKKVTKAESKKSMRKANEAKHQQAENIKAEAIRLYQMGKSIEEIKEILGRSDWAVWNYLKDVRKSIFDRSWEAETIKLYNEGLKYGEIAERTGVAVNVAADRLRRLRAEGKVGRRRKCYTR